MNPLLLSALKMLFGLGSSVLPRATGLMAFRLFCTPPQIKPKNKNTIERTQNGEKLLQTGEQISIDLTEGHIAVYDFSAAQRPNSQAVLDSTDHSVRSPTIILVHGFQSRASYMSGFIEPLLEHGYRVVAFDLPAHGLSSGKRYHVPIAVEALQAVYDYAGSCHAMISHSLGGVVAATLLSKTMPAFRNEVTVQKLVMISPPNSIPRLFQDYIDMVGLRGKASAVFFSMINKLSGCQPEDFITANQLKEIGVPTLLMHAPDDKEVPFSDAEDIAAINPAVTLKVVPGKGHRRILWSDDTIHDAVQFVIGK